MSEFLLKSGEEAQYSTPIQRLIRNVAHTAGRALDMLLPPRCPGSGEVVDRPGMISPAFWQQLQFIEDPICACCGLPFGFSVAADSLCAACLEHEPPFARARAGVVYNDASRQLLLDFKYGDKMHTARSFMPWLLRAGQDLLRDADAVVPVPLHPWRLWRRRFNQSAVLAAQLAAQTGGGCRYLPGALVRRRHTLPQKGLSRKDRQQNVRNAFAVPPRQAPHVAGKNILLVDDVFTSGATLHECARILKRAGAARVDVLTVARVTLEEI